VGGILTDNHDELVVAGVDFVHFRLLDLTRIANQAEPFYRWVEIVFQRATHSSQPLEKLVKSLSLRELERCIRACYKEDSSSSMPKLFNGGGVPYSHRAACFNFFAWLARDAATQRLKPLIAEAKRNIRAKQNTQIDPITLEVKVLATLLCEYRCNLQYFEWPVFREVALSRLEGSRRAMRGSETEIYVRTALAEAFSFYYKTRGNYGRYKDFQILETPLKVNNRTYDVAAILTDNQGGKRHIILPVKTRETQGGGHAHLFTRDIEQANQEILQLLPNSRIVSVIIAQNWSLDEISRQEQLHGSVIHFDVNPNRFMGFDEEHQRVLNRIVEKELDQ